MSSTLRTTAFVKSRAERAPRLVSAFTAGWLALFAASTGACGAKHGSSTHTASGPVTVEPGNIDTIVGTGQRATDAVDANADGIVDPPIPALEAHIDTPMDTVVTPDGDLIVIDWNGHKLRSLDAEGLLAFVVGTGTEGDACETKLEDGQCPAAATELNHPTDAFVDSSGVTWISAWHNSKIKRLDADRAAVENVCGTGNRKFEGDGGPCRDDAGMDLVSFDLPSSVALDAAGNVFISDQSNQVVRRLGANGVIKTVAGHCPGTTGFGCPKGRGYAGDGGPAVDCELNNNVGQGAGPHGKLALDAAGNLYIADTMNHVVRMVSPGADGVIGDGDPAEELITTVAGTGEPGSRGDGGAATAAQLFQPTDVAVGADGSLFIADTGNSCVRRVDLDGIISTVAGVCGTEGYAGDGGRATDALLRSPYGVSLDGGALYIADGLNHRIRKVVLDL